MTKENKAMDYQTMYCCRRKEMPVRVVGYFTTQEKQNGEIFTIFRSKDGSRTYKKKTVKTWDQLSIEKKKAVIQQDYVDDLYITEYYLLKDQPSDIERVREEKRKASLQKYNYCMEQLVPYFIADEVLHHGDMTIAKIDNRILFLFD